MLLTLVTQYLVSYGVAASMAGIAAYGLMIIVVLLAAVIANFIVKNIVLRFVVAMIQKSKATWDDALINSKLLSRLSNFVPVLILYFALPLIFSELPFAKTVCWNLRR